MTVLKTLPSESVHTVCTSPPFWGLRDYGTATWEGGDEACDHRQNGTHVGPKSTLRSDGREHTGPYDGEKAVTEGLPYRAVCGKCGATRIDAQLGLEPTPEEYVANLVAVFREVRRVLRKDGTVWLNLGDSYAGSWGAQSRPTGNAPSAKSTLTTNNGRGPKAGDKYSALSAQQITAAPKRVQTGTIRSEGLKPKDLVGIPWRVAFALQADGWYLRSDVIWSKPNPMPESVTDRPTKSHEYLFLLAKSARYYFDADAVREGHLGRHGGGTRKVSERNHGGRTDGYSRPPDDWTPTTGRNIRSVWTIATAPYPGAHFATFPPKLIEPCIKAGTSERGVCPECGAPWERVVERARIITRQGHAAVSFGQAHGTDGRVALRASLSVETTGWAPTCACCTLPDCILPTHGRHSGPTPATILDPFAGSGTTGMVAQSLSRRAVLIDLSLDYLGQLMGRNADIPLGLGA